MKTQFQSALPQPSGFTASRSRQEIARMLRANRRGSFAAVVRRTPAGYTVNGRLLYSIA